MTAAFLARVPALAALVAVAVLATATLTLAATTSPAPAPATPVAASEPATMVVPDVRRQVYVFAKGTLEQSGFAWKVAGAVQGYAANVVVAQTPAPGTRVLANGSPTVRLTLSRNGAYAQEGLPENASPYPGTPARSPEPVRAEPAPAASLPPAAKPKPAAKPEPAAKPKAAAKKPVAKNPAAPKTAKRKPAFAVAGAPVEPLDEIALPARARQLAVWLESHRKPTRPAVNHWLYQHNWIVTGAAFGWSGGAEALRTLLAVDRRVQKLWGIGARSEQLARTTLARIEARQN